jgi:hypothetical protein
VGPTPVGRERELAAVDSLLDDPNARSAALVIDGEAGIGKTTVVGAGIAAAPERGYRVLSCRPVQSEVALPFVGLGDLF